MSTTTTNASLVKPDAAETVSRVTHFNDNWDNIDGWLTVTGVGATGSSQRVHVRDIAVTPSYVGTTSKATLDIQPTWNTTGVMQGIRIVVTHTLADATSRAIEVKRGANTIFEVDLSTVAAVNGLGIKGNATALGTLQAIGAASDIGIQLTPKGTSGVIINGGGLHINTGSLTLGTEGFRASGTTAATTDGFTFTGDTDLGMYRQAADSLSFGADGAEAMRLSDPGNDETVMMLRVDRGGVETLSRVTLGAADSGGAGFKALRVAN